MTSNKLVATRRQVRFRGCATAVSSVFQVERPEHRRVSPFSFLSSLFPLIFPRTEMEPSERVDQILLDERRRNGRKNVVGFFRGKRRRGKRVSFPFCVPRSSSSWLSSSSKRPALILGARVGPSSLLLAATFTKYSILPCPVLSYPDQVSYVPRALCSLS